MEVDQFKEKLNKIDGNVYVIEEVVQVTNGVYEGELLHDNVNASTLTIYTGPKLTGERIQSYVLSTPSMTPWKHMIRIYADVPRVYISYETDGDTVEAEDINKVQEAVIVTQKAVNSEVVRAEAAEKALTEEIQNETTRAEAAERLLADNLESESARATQTEKKLTDDLSAEVRRATGAERTLTENLSAEAARATEAEQKLTADLAAEVTRSKVAEKTLTDNLSAEVTRAKTAEQIITDNLLAEEARAQDAEKGLADDLTAESIRARAAEKANVDSLATETARAGARETEISSNLSSEITRAKGAEKMLTDNLAAEVTRAKAAEKTNSDSVSVEVSRAKAKEAELQGNITAEVSRATAAENDIRSTISTNKPNWDDKYTRNEVDNKFSALETAIDWKEAVATFADLATTYPKPDDGWTVNVKDTDYTYRWSGTTWIAISANAIPKATQSVDGLLSKEDKAALDDTNTKKHTHSNKSTLDKLTETLLTNWTDAYNKRHEHGNKTVIDKITQTLLDNWTAAHTHISDTVKHITASERTNWNDADSKKHTHTNKAVIDKITQILLDNWSAAYTHISDAVKHITADERTTWNTVSNKVDKVSGKQLSTNDYTAAEKNKLSGIAPGAEVNVQSDWNVIDENSDAYIKNKPTSMPASDVLAWAKAANKPAYSWTEITSKPSTFPPSSHNHTKNQITDMPTKVSQFTNDAGYITQADVDTSQSHTHDNKTVLDKITQALVDTWNGKAGTSVATQAANGLMAAADKKKLDGVATGANNYVHPTASGNKHIPSGGTSGQFLKWSADGTAVWAADNNTTYSAFKAATASAAGGAGLVPAPAAGAQAKYLRADGTWQTPPNTTYSDMKGATASAAGTHGLVPAPAAGAQTKYLRADGSWQTPPDTKYTHPNSGVVAGEYQSVTVNAQGHVTGGVPKGAFTWAQLKGAYTWGQLKGGS